MSELYVRSRPIHLSDGELFLMAKMEEDATLEKKEAIQRMLDVWADAFEAHVKPDKVVEDGMAYPPIG